MYVLSIYEARTLLRLDVSQCRTHVVSDTDTTPTHIYTELYDFLKLLAVLACQCHVRCPCLYPCFIAFHSFNATFLFKFVHMSLICWRQVLGASWYLLSVDRYTTCWKSLCKKERSPHNCFLYLDCSSLNNDMRKIWVNTTDVFNRCDPSNDDIPFKYGLFENALTKHVVSSNFVSKYLYCLWWGLQQLRYAMVLTVISYEI
jgi:hypothetical protein